MLNEPTVFRRTSLIFHSVGQKKKAKGELVFAHMHLLDSTLYRKHVRARRWFVRWSDGHEQRTWLPRIDWWVNQNQSTQARSGECSECLLRGCWTNSRLQQLWRLIPRFGTAETEGLWMYRSRVVVQGVNFRTICTVYAFVTCEVCSNQ